MGEVHWRADTSPIEPVSGQRMATERAIKPSRNQQLSKLTHGSGLLSLTVDRSATENPNNFFEPFVGLRH